MIRILRFRIWPIIAASIFAGMTFQSCKKGNPASLKGLDSSSSEKYDLLVIGDVQRKLNIDSKFKSKGETGELTISIDDIKTLAPDFQVLGNKSSDPNPSDKMKTLALKELIRENGVSAGLVISPCSRTGWQRRVPASRSDRDDADRQQPLSPRRVAWCSPVRSAPATARRSGPPLLH